MNWIHKIFTFTLLTFFLGTMFFSLFHMSMEMNMGMSDGMIGCTFMSHEETICPMNLADHFEAWKSVFISVVPTLILLIAIAGTVALIVVVAPNLLQKIQYGIPILHRRVHERTYTFVSRSLQELFSNGILHPKLFIW